MLIDEEVTLKRFYRNNGDVVLKPDTNAYPPKFFTDQDFKNVRVLGKAILFQSRV